MENIIHILNHVPVGFRFRPTDEELINYYLKHKLLGDDFPVHIIPEIDLCKVEPWDVAAKSVIKSDDPEWFFFSPVDYKYSNSKRVNRTTERGFWKATGKDRNIRRRGTNSVIGTKKTLVFHVGRVPRGVKSNWVIHEYHAVTSHQTQKTFVLCHLMKKAGKITEGEFEAPIIYEGEPSRHVTFDCENATAERIPSVDTLDGTNMEAFFEAIQESQIGIEQESLLSPSLNTYFGNENVNEKTPFEASDEEDKFVNSIWAEEEFVINEERRQCFVNSSTQPKSLRRVYDGSGGGDAEVVSNLHEDISSGEFPASKMFRSSHDVVHGGTSRRVSNHEANTEKSESIIQDNFWAMEIEEPNQEEEFPSYWDIDFDEYVDSFEAQHYEEDSTTVYVLCTVVGSESNSYNPYSEEDLDYDMDLEPSLHTVLFLSNMDNQEEHAAVDEHLESNCIEISSSPSTTTRLKNQYHLGPDNFILQRTVAGRPQTRRRVSNTAGSHVKAQTEFVTVKSEKDQKNAQNTSSKDNLESRRYQSSDVNRKGSFIYMETISSSQSLLPRSVYLMNVFIGILLLIVISWGVLSC